MIGLISAPTNLGLRPPVRGAVPGTAKAPEALREAGLHERLARLGAVDAGVILPGRYVDDDETRAPGHVRNEAALVEHARRLAARVDAVLDAGRAPLVLGGDCSLVIGAGLASGAQRPWGLVHVDGHTDFRHPALTDACASVAGEDLAAAIGLHWPAISDIDGRGPYFAAARTVHVGCRDDDPNLPRVRAAIGLAATSREVLERGAHAVAADILDVAGTTGFWLQLDVDVLDPMFMPAVDSTTPGGLTPDALVELLRALTPYAAGAAVTVFDPDLDPDGRCAELLVDVLVDGLARLGDEMVSVD
ncbi:arginase [Microbacterium terrae]|uniref:Arginase n=1 Tax=Microbacterium terrae TaxID=69369 RepID=A0A0M2GXR6_9MICO|nr:arginase family protein [Microbacterium terrae]KJL38764.1 Arginase [Microbacterium terrae]MBP1076183.1 arginase [Microbacterium terrae]GLJ97003.1 arginase [Microbacterium terrae]